MSITTIRFGSQKATKVTKLEFMNDTVHAFVSANIPLQKLDNLASYQAMVKQIHQRQYLGSFLNSAGAGDLPNPTTLCASYMNILKMEEESKIKEAVKDQAIVMLCDETTNHKGECVFVVLFRIILASDEHKMLVAGAKVLNNANSTEYSRTVVDILLKYGVKYEKVCSFISDSAKYMGKSVEMYLSPKIFYTFNARHTSLT
ncbi:hypothetical protein PR048_033005 [Dryococelus australis]|uniref:DUF4371 domain-containing protein n=1 Tax=Dryococelus australis TaxID=614101 RepID=A0ABQ9G3T9_9NEOP|nr:hypothetical protein PR048_033005 [Dryococelus australis]